MPHITRRHFVGAAAAASVGSLLIRTKGASAAEFSFKCGNDVPVTHPASVRLQEAAAKILEESGGRFELRIFPNNQLGGSTDQLSQVRSGALEMMTLSGNILSTLTKPTSLIGVAYAFPDYKHVWDAMDGEVGKYLRGTIEKAGLTALDKMWDNGFRQMTSSTHPINTPEDLKGFKMRVPVSPQFTSLFRAFGASPTAINFSEAYSALQTKIVNGQENALQLIDLAKLYEVQKYTAPSPTTCGMAGSR